MADTIMLLIGYGLALSLGLGITVIIISWIISLFWAIINAAG